MFKGLVLERRVAVVVATLVCAGSTSTSFGMGKNRDNRPDAATSVLAAFQGTCSSQGAYTVAANAQTQSIINVIETLKATDSCKPYVSELSTIQTAANQMQSLQTSSSYSTYQTDQQNYQLLTLALQNSSPGSSTATNLQSALDSLRLQMYTDQASYDVSTSTSRHNLIVNQSTAMLNWGQTLATTSSSPGLLQCLKQSPAAALELGVNLAAYGGSFLPGAFGAGAAGLGQLINTGLESLRDGQYDLAVFKAQENQMPDALECALESMSESYCNAEDSVRLLNLARDNRLRDYSSTPLWRGIDIQGRQLPSLLLWLSKVQNEIPPQDSYQANRQNGVLQEILQIQQQNLNSIATINNALNQAEFSTTFSAKTSVISNAIVGLAGQLITPGYSVTTSNGQTSVNTVPTPFLTFQPSTATWACWLVKGYNANCPALLPVDQNPQGNPATNQLLDYIQVTLNLNNPSVLEQTEASLLNNWNQILPVVQILVNSDFARIISTNAGTILAEARSATNGYPVSPFQVLQNIDAFLQGMIDFNGNNPRLPVALMQEKEKIDDAMKQLTAPDNEVCQGNLQLPGRSIPIPVASGTPPPASVLTSAECQNERLVNLFNLFNLQNGTQVLLTDMNDLINIDLQARFTSGEVANDPTKILQASGEDLDVALESAGSGDLDPLASDLDNARSDYEGNIQVFRQFFVKAFQQVVVREGTFAATESLSAGANRPHGQRLAELCMLWLLTSNIPASQYGTLDNWPDVQTKAVCEKSLYFNENIAPSTKQAALVAFDIGKLSKSLSSTRFEDRICTFHNYKIQNRADTLYTNAPATAGK